MTDLHIHTHFSSDSVERIHSYISAARASGDVALGFSDHCPWIFEDDFISGMRMHPSEVDAYFSSLEALKII